MGRGLYVKLTKAELLNGVAIGTLRQESAIRLGRRPGNYLKADPETQLAYHIRGACGECATHHCFPEGTWHRQTDKIYGVPDITGHPVPIKIDSKATELDWHRLQVGLGEDRDSLKRDWAYVMVSAENSPYFWVAGFLWGHELQDGWFLDKRGKYALRPAYRAQTWQLHPMYILQQIVRGERSPDEPIEQFCDWAARPGARAGTARRLPFASHK